MTTLPVVPHVSELDLGSLLAQVGFGSVEAFADLYDHFAPAMHGMSSAMFTDAGEAAVATEEAFLRIWRSAPRYREGQDPDRWLFMVAMRSVGRRLDSSSGLDEVA